jgi:AraC-like DNA-binding protein
MNSYLHIQPGLLILHGSVLDNDWHQHNAIQIIWPESVCNLDLAEPLSEITADVGIDVKAHVIDSGIKHRLDMQQGWVILIEPQTQLGELLQANQHTISALGYFKQDKTEAINFTQLQPLWQALGAKHVLTEFIQIKPQLDSRIQALQQKLNVCLESECIKPDQWKAACIAQELGLSESRFLHVFKAEMKIAWRPYLLWRRLLCAVNSIQKGRSATEAAYIAGFSDSAHLSRTFRNTFGMTIRHASQATPK